MRFHRHSAQKRRHLKALENLRRDPHLAKDLGLPPIAPAVKIPTGFW